MVNYGFVDVALPFVPLAVEQVHVFVMVQVGLKIHLLGLEPWRTISVVGGYGRNSALHH